MTHYDFSTEKNTVLRCADINHDTKCLHNRFKKENISQTAKKYDNKGM